MFSRLKRQEKLVEEQRPPHSMTTITGSIEAEPIETDERIEDYLDQVCGRLLTLSFPERKQIRQELHQHIEAMIEARCELGESRREAAIASLEQFGTPENVSRSFVEAYLSSGQNRGLIPWLSIGKAFRSFGTAGVLTTLLFIAWVSYLPNGDVPAATRVIVQQAIQPIWIFLVPALLGWRLGADEKTTRPMFASFLALAALSILSLPLTYALFAGGAWTNQVIGGASFVFVAWIPNAILCAGLSSQFTRWQRSLRNA